MQAERVDADEFRTVQVETEIKAAKRGVVCKQTQIKTAQEDHHGEGNDQQPVPGRQHRAHLKKPEVTEEQEVGGRKLAEAGPEKILKGNLRAQGPF